MGLEPTPRITTIRDHNLAITGEHLLSSASSVRMNLSSPFDHVNGRTYRKFRLIDRLIADTYVEVRHISPLH
jgi:hypothetical protein